MRVLVIGGTRFVGRSVVAEARDRGHEVVLFNRGRTNPDLFPDLVTVRGDRKAGDLTKLAGEQFDVVIDVTAYHPDDVAATAPLAANIGQYVMISTASVYRDPVSRHADEGAPLWTLQEPLPAEAATPEEYGGLKALCELTAQRVHDRPLIVRPGLVVGPNDYSERLASWLRRLNSRGEVLAGVPDQPLQLIDVRDLAAWVLSAAERRFVGPFNAVGEPLSFATFLSTACTALEFNLRVCWAGDDFLTSHGVALPFWLPRPDHPFFELSNAQAVSAGLRLRPLSETLVDVWAADDRQSLSQSELAAEDELLEKLLAESPPES